MSAKKFNYGGFFIKEAVGNNAFSYDERENKKIYVPELIEANLSDVKLGNMPSFIEIEDGVENICTGLEYMYKIVEDKYSAKQIYLFDNHNQSFYFWCKALNENFINKGLKLLHVDQHKDTRPAENYEVDISNMNEVNRYTNEVLNVGSFIDPAMKLGIFSELFIVDSTYTLRNIVKGPYVLDLDLDFFSIDMDYIDYDEKIERVREYIGEASLITIATSPYFIEQERAIKALNDLLLI
ncbi:UPF0489 family protein [Peptostreptococcus equinus]|uniref:UPF0489 family protein n=1 Tax=Peptostreptococcus equinus TaxID=3003601 RepID=A0ABY7JNS7_9FIRM|nr:UPF0489 family protein [Peptostreptococcus sp. CBA3647]WAW14997.1 UPF0489 family protein [Peptostreptococcus sp. CBA3647]